MHAFAKKYLDAYRDSLIFMQSVVQRAPLHTEDNNLNVCFNKFLFGRTVYLSPAQLYSSLHTSSLRIAFLPIAYILGNSCPGTLCY